ncbi:GcrA family cell cycle regulator [Sphingomonas hankookensis]|uniref:GcrA family cell cycle regulator n=1 Tax=Sphingomonas hankookensis TaxID=563996 RepID=UPI003D302D76
MSWTEERIATLAKMWESGMTASQIAEELGGISRNAVIGKAHRTGTPVAPVAGTLERRDQGSGARAQARRARTGPGRCRAAAPAPAGTPAGPGTCPRPRTRRRHARRG